MTLHELQDVLDDTTHDLTQALPDVKDLRSWAVYFLKALEAETDYREEYERMLANEERII